MNKGTAIVGFLLCFLAGGMLMYGVDRNGTGIKSGGWRIPSRGLCATLSAPVSSL